MRVVIPTNLQDRILNELHFTHPGIIKMKLLATQLCVVAQTGQ